MRFKLRTLRVGNQRNGPLCHLQFRLRVAEGGLDAQARGVAAAKREVEFASHFGEVGVATFGGGFGAERFEEGMESTPDDIHILMRLRPGAHVEDLAPRRPAAVVAEAEKDGGGFKTSFFGMCERRVKATGNLVASRPVPARLNAVAEDSSSGRSPPPERLFRKRHQILLRTPEGEGLHSGGGHDVRQPRRVAEGVGLPRHARPDAKARREIRKPRFVLAAQREGAGEIRVGLDPGAAHDIPAPLPDAVEDTGEGGGIGFLEMAVDRRLAPDERELGEFVHEVEDRANGPDTLVEALAGVPEPHGIEVGVGNDVERGHELFPDDFVSQAGAVWSADAGGEGEAADIDDKSILKAMVKEVSI